MAWLYNLRLSRTVWSWLPYAVAFGCAPLFLSLGLDGQARGGKLLAEDRRDAIAHRLDLVMRTHAAVVLQEESDIGTRQRDALEDAFAMPELGGLGAQELAPRGRVEVQVGHRHRGAGLPRSGLH